MTFYSFELVPTNHLYWRRKSRLLNNPVKSVRFRLMSLTGSRLHDQSHVSQLLLAIRIFMPTATHHIYSSLCTSTDGSFSVLWCAALSLPTLSALDTSTIAEIQQYLHLLRRVVC